MRPWDQSSDCPSMESPSQNLLRRSRHCMTRALNTVARRAPRLPATRWLACCRFAGEISEAVFNSIERDVSTRLDCDGLPSTDPEFSATIAERQTPALLPGFVDSRTELEVGLAIGFEARYERALSRL
jgi:hypothetical protein